MQENNLNNSMYPVPKRRLSKQLLALIIIALILLGALMASYFVRKSPKEREATVEEKIQILEDVANKNKEQGLPVKEKQIDIMNFNAQN